MSWGAVIGSVAGAALTGAMSDSGGGGGSSAEVAAAGQKGLEGIDQLFSTLLGTTDEFSKQSAIADTQGLMQALFTQFQNEALPNIFQMENASGGYNSTTGQLLANDAFSSTVAKGAAAQLEAIQNYRKLQQGDFSTLANLVGSISGTNAMRGDNSAQAGMLGDVTGSVIGGLVNEWNKPNAWGSPSNTPGPGKINVGTAQG